MVDGVADVAYLYGDEWDAVVWPTISWRAFLTLWCRRALRPVCSFSYCVCQSEILHSCASRIHCMAFIGGVHSVRHQDLDTRNINSQLPSKSHNLMCRGPGTWPEYLYRYNDIWLYIYGWVSKLETSLREKGLNYFFFDREIRVYGKFIVKNDTRDWILQIRPVPSGLGAHL